MPHIQIELPRAALTEFCRRWMITEFALFGSVLRDDFGPESDVDVLVTYAPDAEWSLLDHVRMERELGQLLGRRVDAMTRRSIERSHNERRRGEILSSAVSVAGA